MYVYIHIYIDTYIDIFIHEYTYIYTYVYIFIYAHMCAVTLSKNTQPSTLFSTVKMKNCRENPLTEEIRLQIFASPDVTRFTLNDGNSP